MAIASGEMCIACEGVEARDQSHFCSVSCEAAWIAAHDGPVNCDGGANRRGCVDSHAAVSAAIAAGWIDVQPDPEGVSNNYAGTCKECQL